jgi:hypothetical protein
MAQPHQQGNLLSFGFTRRTLGKGEEKPPPSAEQLAREQREKEEANIRKAKRKAQEEAAAAAVPKRAPGRPKMPSKLVPPPTVPQAPKGDSLGRCVQI